VEQGEAAQGPGSENGCLSGVASTEHRREHVNPFGDVPPHVEVGSEGDGKAQKLLAGVGLAEQVCGGTPHVVELLVETGESLSFGRPSEESGGGLDYVQVYRGVSLG
jgi:hypothetical protein